MNIYNDINLEIGLDTLAVRLGILLKMAEQAFLTFPVRSMSNVYCWLALLPPSQASSINSTENQPGIALKDFFWKYENTSLDLTCRNCTSPQLPDLFTELYKTGEDEYDQIEELGNRVLEGEALQRVFKLILDTSQNYCPHSAEYDPEAAAIPNFLDPGGPTTVADAEGRDPNAVFFNIFFGSLGALVLLCFIVARIFIRCKNRRWKDSLSDEGRMLLKQLEEKERERDTYLDQTMGSLFNSQSIDAHIRWGAPVMILVNIGLFVGSHLGTGFSIALDVHIAGDEFHVQNMFRFNFADGLRNTYENGGYEMAIFLLIFLGIWPYLRCLMSLILWFVPPRWLASSHRGRILIWIDAMNKLTVRDIFKFLLIIAVIFIFIGGAYVWEEAKSTLYAMTIIVVPGPAVYCGVSAMILSRVSSVWLVDYHNRELDAAVKAYHQDQLSPIAYGVVEITEHDDDEDLKKEEVVVDDDDSVVPITEISVPGSRFFMICGRRFLLGNLSVALGIFVVALVVIVALVYLPAVSLDLSSLVELILESGTTYEQAISEFGVYAFVCAVLLKARLVLESRTDFVAVTLMFALGVAAAYFMGFLSLYRWIRAVYTKGWRQLFPLFFEKDPNVVKLPAYLRLHAHRHSTSWVVAYTIGIFQLGAVTIYAINYFCSLLDSIYYAVAFVGLIETTEGKCWEAQMSQVHNLVVFVGCFGYLTFCLIGKCINVDGWGRCDVFPSHSNDFLCHVQCNSLYNTRPMSAWSANHCATRTRKRISYNVLKKHGSAVV